MNQQNKAQTSQNQKDSQVSQVESIHSYRKENHDDERQNLQRNQKNSANANTNFQPMFLAPPNDQFNQKIRIMEVNRQLYDIEEGEIVSSRGSPPKIEISNLQQNMNDQSAQQLQSQQQELKISQENHNYEYKQNDSNDENEDFGESEENDQDGGFHEQILKTEFNLEKASDSKISGEEAQQVHSRVDRSDQGEQEIFNDEQFHHQKYEYLEMQEMTDEEQESESSSQRDEPESRSLQHQSHLDDPSELDNEQVQVSYHTARDQKSDSVQQFEVQNSKEKKDPIETPKEDLSSEKSQNPSPGKQTKKQSMFGFFDEKSESQPYQQQKCQTAQTQKNQRPSPSRQTVGEQSKVSKQFMSEARNMKTPISEKECQEFSQAKSKFTKKSKKFSQKEVSDMNDQITQNLELQNSKEEVEEVDLSERQQISQMPGKKSASNKLQGNLKADEASLTQQFSQANFQRHSQLTGTRSKQQHQMNRPSVGQEIPESEQKSAKSKALSSRRSRQQRQIEIVHEFRDDGAQQHCGALWKQKEGINTEVAEESPQIDIQTVNFQAKQDTVQKGSVSQPSQQNDQAEPSSDREQDLQEAASSFKKFLEDEHQADQGSNTEQAEDDDNPESLISSPSEVYSRQNSLGLPYEQEQQQNGSQTSEENQNQQDSDQIVQDEPVYSDRSSDKNCWEEVENDSQNEKYSHGRGNQKDIINSKKRMTDSDQSEEKDSRRHNEQESEYDDQDEKQKSGNEEEGEEAFSSQVQSQIVPQAQSQLQKQQDESDNFFDQCQLINDDSEGQQNEQDANFQEQIDNFYQAFDDEEEEGEYEPNSSSDTSLAHIISDAASEEIIVIQPQKQSQNNIKGKISAVNFSSEYSKHNSSARKLSKTNSPNKELKQSIKKIAEETRTVEDLKSKKEVPRNYEIKTCKTNTSKAAQRLSREELEQKWAESVDEIIQEVEDNNHIKQYYPSNKFQKPPRKQTPYQQNIGKKVSKKVKDQDVAQPQAKKKIEVKEVTAVLKLSKPTKTFVEESLVKGSQARSISNRKHKEVNQINAKKIVKEIQIRPRSSRIKNSILTEYNHENVKLSAKKTQNDSPVRAPISQSEVKQVKISSKKPDNKGLQEIMNLQNQIQQVNSKQKNAGCHDKKQHSTKDVEENRSPLPAKKQLFGIQEESKTSLPAKSAKKKKHIMPDQTFESKVDKNISGKCRKGIADASSFNQDGNGNTKKIFQLGFGFADDKISDLDQQINLNQPNKTKKVTEQIQKVSRKRDIKHEIKANKKNKDKLNAFKNDQLTINVADTKTELRNKKIQETIVSPFLNTKPKGKGESLKKGQKSGQIVQEVKQAKHFELRNKNSQTQKATESEQKAHSTLIKPSAKNERVIEQKKGKKASSSKEQVQSNSYQDIQKGKNLLNLKQSDLNQKSLRKREEIPKNRHFQRKQLHTITLKPVTMKSTKSEKVEPISTKTRRQLQELKIKPASKHIKKDFAIKQAKNARTNRHNIMLKLRIKEKSALIKQQKNEAKRVSKKDAKKKEVPHIQIETFKNKRDELTQIIPNSNKIQNIKPFEKTQQNFGQQKQKIKTMKIAKTDVKIKQKVKKNTLETKTILGFGSAADSSEYSLKPIFNQSVHQKRIQNLKLDKNNLNDAEERNRKQNETRIKKITKEKPKKSLRNFKESSQPKTKKIEPIKQKDQIPISNSKFQKFKNGAKQSKTIQIQIQNSKSISKKDNVLTGKKRPFIEIAHTKKPSFGFFQEEVQKKK